MAIAIAVLGLILGLGQGRAMAAPFDFTGVPLSGSNPYTYNDAVLGAVTLTYSGSYNNTIDGLTTKWAGTTTLGLGEISGMGVLTATWTNAVSSLDVRYYDLDLGERVTFNVPMGVAVSLLADNPLDGSDFLDGNTLKASAGSIDNGNASNYATLQLSGSPFTTFEASFYRPSGTGGSSLSFGDPLTTSAPTPAALPAGLALMGVCGLARRRR
ncbi:hypothetical protein HED60_10970 [Planctomycetales bacterium ZRK34]|nr:hypothetical protein HED60_10970 [Planctomycetales bacterium ZRK34]